MFEALTNSHIAVTGRSVTLGVPSTLAHAQLESRMGLNDPIGHNDPNLESGKHHSMNNLFLQLIMVMQGRMAFR